MPQGPKASLGRWPRPMRRPEAETSAPAPETSGEFQTNLLRRLESKLSQYKEEIIRALAIPILALGLELVEWRPPKPVFADEPLPKGKIVFVSDEGGQRDIYVADLDGGNKRNLANNSQEDSNPKWLKDGSGVVFASDTGKAPFRDLNLFIADPESGELHQLTFDSNNTQFFPTLNMFPEPTKYGMILFSRQKLDQTAGIDLFLLDPETGKMERLTRERLDSHIDETQPSVSGDGKLVAYFRSVFNELGSGGESGIVISPIDAINPEASTVKFVGTNPVLSPDGDSVWFLNTVFNPDSSIETILYRGSLKGGEAQPVVGGFSNIQGFSFSPDGKWIIFSASRGFTDDFDLYILPAEGGEPRRLFDTPWNEWSPDWEPARVPERVILAQITGLGGEVSGGGGFVKGGIYIEVEALAKRLGIPVTQIFPISQVGNRVENGRNFTEEQTCFDTFTHPDGRATVIADFFVDWFNENPNDEMFIVIHSEGIQPTIRAMRAVKEAKTSGTPEERERFRNVRPDRINIIAGQTAALGIDKLATPYLGLLFPDEATRCKILFDLLPSPETVSQVSVLSLFETWDNRREWAREVREVVDWWQEEGGRVVSIVNPRDDVLSLRYGYLPEIIWEMMLLKGRIPEVVQTQIVPGTEDNGDAYMFLLPRGHDQVFKRGPGLELIERIIREEANLK